MQDLLDFARKRPLNLTSSSLRTLVSEVLEVARSRPGVAVHNEVPEDLPLLDADRDQLRQVLLNLVDVRSAAEALAQIAQGPIDTCVVDLVMPELNGAALCQRIHELDRDVTLLVMTGQNVPQLVQEASRAGSYACLRKPFDVEALVRIVARARLDA